MLVYGDPQFEMGGDEFLEDLHSQLRSSRTGDIDSIRHLLIQAGQLEQAIFDKSDPTDETALLSKGLTDLAAVALHTIWAISNGVDVSPNLKGSRIYDSIEDTLQALSSIQDCKYAVKVPEGYAYYSLFPEQYFLSSKKWSIDHTAPEGRVVIVGIRSIGTSLSAVVKVALQALGWHAHRFNMRPNGGPQECIAHINRESLRHADWAIVVDEGPGLSGSSMASVAEALVSAGMSRDTISFLPGHLNLPPVMETARVREWWERAPRHAVSLGDVKWGNLSLTETLARKTLEIWPGEHIDSVRDLSDGSWRKLHYHSEEEWPALSLPFERTKFLYSTRSGLRMLWKFAGLGPCPQNGSSWQEWTFGEIFSRAGSGWCSPPLGKGCGFVAMSWIDGTPLKSADAADPTLVSDIGHYIADVAGPALSDEGHEAAVERLHTMLRANVREILGENLEGEEFRSLIKTALEGSCPASFGDGSLAPHQWLRARDGCVLKLGGISHWIDQTFIGKQSMLWDVAGARIEWNLDSIGEALLEAALEDYGWNINSEALRFYEIAYLAFRVGQTATSSQKVVEPSERERLLKASAAYRAMLEIKLELPAGKGH